MAEEQAKTPLTCPATMTIRRNPPRRARPTPYSNIPLPLPLSSPLTSHHVPPFPVQDILSIELPKITAGTDTDNSNGKVGQIPSEDENLKVFVRVRPLAIRKTVLKEGKRQGNAWPKNPRSKETPKKNEKKRGEICVVVNDKHSVIVTPPPGVKRCKSEIYKGFSCVFSDKSSQNEVYEKMVSPLVEDFLSGKSGMLAALGPSGSGKTHTVFGCARDPGMVPRALHHILSQDKSKGTQLARTFHLSMLEICSEKGKSERLCDLLQDGIDVYMQQSTIKGLQEVLISQAQEAESLIACGMLKRATAMTNSNSQSSRSQCIINIRGTFKKVDGKTEDESSSAVLTIVDLAGAEREKKTGNQGLRLLESNFINNTSMVFGLCMRSLLEHQKNPKKPLQKNFHNSLLTRYLKPYLEGKKRMALVLTVKPGEEDYFDTSNLLKQAAPFSQIRFSDNDEPGNTKCAKRPLYTPQRKEDLKRTKFNGLEAHAMDERIMDEKQHMRPAEKVEDDHLTKISVQSDASQLSYLKENSSEAAKREKEQQIMVHMSKALWNVLKQYKEKLKVAETELSCLRVTLADEQKRRIDLENEVKDLKEQKRRIDLENEVKDLKEQKRHIDLENEVKDSKHKTSNRQEASTKANQQLERSHVHCDDAEQLRDPDNLESCDLNSVGRATSTFTGQDGRLIQASEGSNENAVSIKDSSYLKAGDSNVIDGATTICTEREGLLSRECEEGAEDTASIIDTKDLVKDVEEGNSNNKNAEDLPILKVGDHVDNSQESGETDHSESAVSSSGSCTTTDIRPLFDAEIEKLTQKDSEKEIGLLVKVSPEDNKVVRGGKDCKAPNIASKQSDIKKPKRKLLPASTILLKDMASLALEDVNDKPKGAKGGKKVAEDMKNKSKGSISLIRLLKNDVHL